jgi:HAD superfamily hydrolase (TIGR01509 family)
MTSVKALFLDFDGLMCDTEAAARQSWAELYARLGHDLPAAVWTRMVGRSNGHEVATADLSHRAARPITEEELAWRDRRKQELSDVEPLRPGVADLLAAARRRGLVLAAVSSSSARWVRGHLTRLGVIDDFATVITGDDEPRHKPAPDLYLRALAETGLAADEAVAFEDSPSGVCAALAAGLRVVAVPTATTDAGLADATLVVPVLTGFDLAVLTEGGSFSGRAVRCVRSVGEQGP